ncbi:hypothetical protein [Haladaptatus sp. CMSO5]|uniref:hypothetical protein n=1 Tax=Haladaptatus sp. CMSO5 TaxID=3120514 RepID=UPI002FCE268A
MLTVLHGSSENRRFIGIAGLVGIVHAIGVLWIRSALGIYTPVFDLFILWTLPGLTLVGGFATYTLLVPRLYTPTVGITTIFAWATVRQWQYVLSLGNTVWGTAPQPLYFYITLWPLPLVVGVLLARLELAGRSRLFERNSSTLE